MLGTPTLLFKLLECSPLFYALLFRASSLQFQELMKLQARGLQAGDKLRGEGGAFRIFIYLRGIAVR
jgi:hypothetical protein